MPIDSSIQVFLIYPSVFSREGLSQEENARAEKLQSASQKVSFAAAHRHLRRIIARSVGATPESLCFETASTGKPRLPEYPKAGFNISHTHGAAAIVLSKDRSVGIDIEAARKLPELDDLIAQIASVEEANHIRRLNPDERMQAFYHLWTAKESLVKANGLGLSVDLRSVNLDLGLTEKQKIGARFWSGALGEYHWRPVATAEGFASNVAWSNGPAQITIQILDDSF